MKLQRESWGSSDWVPAVLGRENASSGDLVALYLSLGADVQTFQETSGICIMHWIQLVLLNMGSQKPCPDLKGEEDRSSSSGSTLKYLWIVYGTVASSDQLQFWPSIPLNWEQFSRDHGSVFLCRLFHTRGSSESGTWSFWQNLPCAHSPLFPFSPPRKFKSASGVSECLAATVQKDVLWPQKSGKLHLSKC